MSGAMTRARRLLIPILLALSSGCSGGSGTGTGNPGVSFGGGPSPLSASQQVQQAICTLLIQCNPTLTLSACVSGVQASSTIGGQLGVSVTTGITNYLGVENADQQGTLQANSAGLQACLNDISSQSCASPSVMAAYDPISLTPFQNVAGIIPSGSTACHSLF